MSAFEPRNASCMILLSCTHMWRVELQSSSRYLVCLDVENFSRSPFGDIDNQRALFDSFTSKVFSLIVTMFILCFIGRSCMQSVCFEHNAGDGFMQQQASSLSPSLSCYSPAPR